MTEKKYSRIHLFVKSKKYAQKRKFIKYLFSIFIRIFNIFLHIFYQTC